MTKVRISAVSFKAGPISSFSDFAAHVRRLTEEAARAEPDFVIFPELFSTFELMSMFGEASLPDLLARTSDHTEEYLDLFRGLAMEHGTHIIGGSHFTAVVDQYYNMSSLFMPDGGMMQQPKCHLFPPEKSAGAVPGDTFAVVQTEKANISILTCYDLEFPEAARLVTLRGAEILFSPSATLGEAGYWRVRHCGQARCIEDQVYVVHCSLLGGPGVYGLDFWGTSSIMTPCDAAFPARGIAAEGPFNQEVVVTAKVDTDLLYDIRERGAAPTLADRRRDLFEELSVADLDNTQWQRSARTG